MVLNDTYKSLWTNNMQTVDKSHKHYRFRGTEAFSPTLYQLEQFMQIAGMKRTRWSWRARFSDRNLDFSPEACECLEYKHLLAQLMAQYCPEVIPETYILNDYSWMSVLNDVAQDHYMTKQTLIDEVPGLVWILKPSLLNNGQHIQVFQKFSQIEEHMLHPNRLGGPHVLQRYISNPDLYEKRKYSLRFFVVVTQEAGAFLYQQGYLNVALASYSNKNFSDLHVHLTNEHLQHNKPSVVQIPTQDQAKYPIWYPKIRDIAQAVGLALETHFPNAFQPYKDRTFGVFGFDFMLDDQDKMWLLEVNHGPCFPLDSHHPLQEILYQEFWQSMIDQFVLPIVNGEPISKQDTFGFEALR